MQSASTKPECVTRNFFCTKVQAMNKHNNHVVQYLTACSIHRTGLLMASLSSVSFLLGTWSVILFQCIMCSLNKYNKLFESSSGQNMLYLHDPIHLFWNLKQSYEEPCNLAEILVIVFWIAAVDQPNPNPVDKTHQTPKHTTPKQRCTSMSGC